MNIYALAARLEQLSEQGRGRGTSSMGRAQATFLALEINEIARKERLDWYFEWSRPRVWPKIEVAKRRPMVYVGNWRSYYRTEWNKRRHIKWASYVVYPYIPPIEVVAELGYN